ncbi:MAG: AbrB family transcriptional regulator [Geminicoccaceae bacterium]|nr:MAG: AbrB family transcriptional regulator [Geminicoccaceae bacterium]
MTDLRAMALTLAIAGVGGWLFVLLDLPLPWLLGAMLATTAASLAGLRLTVARPVRGSMLVVLGLLIGSAFTPELLAELPRWLWSLAALPLYVVLIGGVVMVYLTRVAGFEPRTAYFAATPGGLGEMVLLADHYGADVRRVALVHSLRVVLLVTAIPFVVAKLGLTLPTPPPAGPPPTWLETLTLLAVGGVGVAVVQVLRVPSGLLLGAMTASAIAHIVGWVESYPPAALVALAQVVIGASVGSRFSGLGARAVFHALGHGAVITVLMLVLAAALAVLVHPLAGIALLPLLIAYVPGGVAEMALIALALGIDPAFVAVHHVVRIALVVGLAPVMLRMATGGRGDVRDGN